MMTSAGAAAGLGCASRVWEAMGTEQEQAKTRMDWEVA
jgi:hypothetical protein